MTTPNDNSPLDFDRLDYAVGELERGNWRAATEALRAGIDVGTHSDALGVVFCLRCVCRCMRLQCAAGDVEAALGELDRASERLCRFTRPGACRPGRLRLLAEPASEQRLPHLVWATTRLVLRERAELHALAVIFRKIKRGRQELVYAAAEHLVWVEFDPWTVSIHSRDQELLGLADDDDAYTRFRLLNPLDISLRATRLRHLANVHGGSVAKRTWQRMGGYGVVREAALLVLAKEPLTRGRSDAPIRLGRVQACEYARRLAAATDA
jgi:hypothetical protein